MNYLKHSFCLVLSVIALSAGAQTTNTNCTQSGNQLNCTSTTVPDNSQAWNQLGANIGQLIARHRSKHTAGPTAEAACNQDSSGKVMCRTLVSDSELEMDRTIVHSMMPEIQEQAIKTCTDWKQDTANTHIGQPGNPAQIVQPEDWARCIDAQTAALKTYLLASGSLELTLLEGIRVERYADCHYPEPFEGHLYWQWSIAIQHRGDLYDSCADTLPISKAWSGAFR